MKGLIVPDVHEQVRRLKAILRQFEEAVDYVVFLGDFMDTFLGLTPETEETILWLRDNLQNRKYRFCVGNHDMSYRFPKEQIICSGYDRAKQRLTDEHLTRDHWKQMKLHHWISDSGSSEWLLSHAGLHPSLLHPVLGLDKKWLIGREKEAFYNLTFDIGLLDPFFRAGTSRGGWAKVGGMTWLDFGREFRPIEGTNQIVGHSNGLTIRENNTPNSRNYCIDTHLRHVALIEDGQVQVLPVAVPVQYRVMREMSGLLFIESSYDSGESWNVVHERLKATIINKAMQSLLDDNPNASIVNTIHFNWL